MIDNSTNGWERADYSVYVNSYQYMNIQYKVFPFWFESGIWDQPPEVIKIFMVNSAEHEILNARK